MTRTRMTASAWVEQNGLRPDFARETASFDTWWEEARGDAQEKLDQQTTLIELGKRWFESGTSPGVESLSRSRDEWRRTIAQAIMRDIVGEDPAKGQWRGEDGFVYYWSGISWSKRGIANAELRGIETLPHGTPACAVRGCEQTRCRDSLQRMRALARTPGRHVRRVWA